MHRPQTPGRSTMLAVLDDDDRVLDDLEDEDDDRVLDDLEDEDDDGLDTDEGEWLLDDLDLESDAERPTISMIGGDWIKEDDGLDPFSVAFAGVEVDVDVERLAQAMLDQGALDPAHAPAADRRHRVSHHPATRRPGRR